MLDHRLQDHGLLLDGAVAVPAPLILFRAAVEEPVNFDFVGGVVGTGKERDDRVAHALMRHVAPAAGVDLFPGHAGALPFRLCVVDAALELLDTEIRAGVIARVPVVRAGAARPAGDGNIVVAEVVGAAGDQTALDAVAVAVAVLDQTVDEIGNVHLRQIKPRVVDIEVVQVILEVHAVAASVVPQAVVAHRGAEDLIAGLLAVGVVQDGEIVRPVFIEISVVRQLLPADNVDLRARLVRGLHLVLEVPQLQHRAVGGEVAERICLLQPRHAHIGDRVFDRAGRIVVVFRHGVGHRAFFEVFHARGGIVVHRGVDRVVLLFQPVDHAEAFTAVFRIVGGKAEIDCAVFLLKKIGLIRLRVLCLFAVAGPCGFVVLHKVVDRRSVSGVAEECVEGLLFQLVFLHRAVDKGIAQIVEHCDVFLPCGIRRGAEGGVCAIRKAIRKAGRFI